MRVKRAANFLSSENKSLFILRQMHIDRFLFCALRKAEAAESGDFSMDAVAAFRVEFSLKLHRLRIVGAERTFCICKQICKKELHTLFSVSRRSTRCSAASEPERATISGARQHANARYSGAGKAKSWNACLRRYFLSCFYLPFHHR